MNQRSFAIAFVLFSGVVASIASSPYATGPLGGGPGRVIVETDRYNPGTQSLQMLDLGLQSRSGMDALVLNGFSSPHQGGALVSTTSSSDSWRYLKCHHLAILVDGRPLQPDAVDHDGTVGRGYVLEHVSFRLEDEDLHALAMAKSFELRLCADEFFAGAAQLTTLKDFARQAALEENADD